MMLSNWRMRLWTGRRKRRSHCSGEAGHATAWVTVPAEDAIYRREGGGWTRHAAPVHEPRGVWSHGAGKLWVVGQDGGAYFDGNQWSRIAKLSGPLTEVVGHQANLWFAGESGVWHGTLDSR